ncbi:MAG: hypothetical protein J2P37_16280 [Ktedonobacteraceae bacterium]|nr:hypothetical protein [Ktedonobacteraceae bacterium]
MDSNMNRQRGEPGQHIWLRYATQISANGRTHSVEMRVPVPIGASAEERERLLREAEEGLGQLISHTVQRVPQVIQRSLTQRTTPTPAPQPAAAPSRPANRPAAMPAPQTAPQPAVSSQAREVPPETARQQGEKVTRPNGGLSQQPSKSNGGEEGRAVMSIPEFLQQARENLNLTSSKMIMQLLKVNSLSGINLREAYDRLIYLVAQDKPAGTPPSSSPPAPPAATDNPGTRQSEQRLSGLDPTLREKLRPASTLPPPRSAPIPVIDEEDDDLEEDDGEYYVTPTSFNEEVDLEDEDLEEGDDEEGSGLSGALRERGWTVIDRLREARGNTTANAARLQVLRNVIDGQIGGEQLQELIEGIWGVTVTKKLKVDQLEALISWAKEDDFVSEVDAVLRLLEEERYARGNR